MLAIFSQRNFADFYSSIKQELSYGENKINTRRVLKQWALCTAQWQAISCMKSISLCALFDICWTQFLESFYFI